MSSGSRLLEASTTGKYSIIVRYLTDGDDINQRDEHGRQAIHLAASRGYSSCVDLLLKRGADIEAAGQYGRTPLLYAAEAGEVGTTRMLLERGANKAYKDEQNNSALHLAAKFGDPLTVEWLLRVGHDIEDRGFCDRTPLLYAAEGGQVNTMQLLLRKGAYKEYRDSEGNSALHLAAQYGSTESVKWLLLRGFDIESRGFNDRTPLLSAAVGGHVSTMRLLFSKGANKAHKDKDNNTALHLVASSGSQESVEWLLDNKLDIESRGFRDRTPLLSAASMGRENNVQTLLNNGADKTSTDVKERSALDLAHEHPEVIDVLSGNASTGRELSKLSLGDTSDHHIYPDCIGGYQLNFREPMVSQGGFGTVYKGIRTSDKMPVVIKQRVYNVGMAIYSGHPRLEIQALRLLGKHENIVTFMDAIEPRPGTVYIVTQYCSLGSLTDCMSKMMPEQAMKVDWMKQIAEGLRYMHSRTPPVAHRDLKPDNILAHLDNGQVVMKLADLGFAKNADNTQMMTLCGTESFMAPEVTPVDGYVKYTISSDIFSLGLVFSVLLLYTPSNMQLNPTIEGHYLTGRQTVASVMRERNLRHQTTPALFTIHESDSYVDQKLKHLIMTMCRLKPEHRITIAIVRHELLTVSEHPLLT